MTRFGIRYSPRAVEDLQTAFEWGADNWGQEEASRWAAKMEQLIEQRLSKSPKACPLAPESASVPLEVRHLLMQRYRVLFNVSDKDVFILRIVGPFSGQALEIDSSDAA